MKALKSHPSPPVTSLHDHLLVPVSPKCICLQSAFKASLLGRGRLVCWYLTPWRASYSLVTWRPLMRQDQPAFCSLVSYGPYSMASNSFCWLSAFYACLFVYIYLSFLFFCSLLHLQQIVKEITTTNLLDFPQLVGVKPEGLGSLWAGEADGSVMLLRASHPLPNGEGRSQQVWFPRECCVSQFPSSSLAIGLCLCSCLFNALSYHLEHFNFSDNLLWPCREYCSIKGVRELYFKSIIIFYTSFPACTSHCTKQPQPQESYGGEGKSFSLPSPPHSLLLKVRLSKDSHSCFLASGPAGVCWFVFSPHRLGQDLESPLQTLHNLAECSRMTRSASSVQGVVDSQINVVSCPQGAGSFT